MFDTIIFVDKKKKVAAWLRDCKHAIDQEFGKTLNIKEFADHVGVPPYLMRLWLRDDTNHLPGGEHVVRIGNMFGFEIYDLMEWDRPKAK